MVLLSWAPLLGAQGLVGVTLPDVTVREGSSFVQPILVEDLSGLDVIAATFEISYDPTLLRATGVSTAGTLTQGWLTATGVFEGRIRIPMANATPAVGAGVFVNVLFEALPGSLGTTHVSVSAAILNRSSARSVTVGSVVVEPPLTALPFSYFLSAGWNLVSLPGLGVSSPLGDVSIAAYTWSAAAQAWVPHRSIDAASLPAVSRGMFVHARQAGSVSLTLDVDSASVRRVPVTLEAGWNLIGAPSNVDATTNFPASLLTSAFTNRNAVFRYDPSLGDYVLASELAPGNGYWVYNDTGSPLPVELVQPRDLSSGTSQTAAPRLPVPDWFLPFRLVGPGGSYRSAEIGVSALSQRGYDALDVARPPALPGTAEFYIEAEGKPGRLSRSVRPLEDGSSEWVLTARVPHGVSHVEWSTPRLDGQWRLVFDGGGGPIEIRNQGRLELRPGVHRLRVRLSRIAPIRSRLLANFPNPFNPETWIPFELSESADVSIHVYDMNGALVRTLNLGRREPGFYTDRGNAAYWDGANAVGERVASGMYVYELRAGTYRALRRMIVLK
jgi:hypothetical protein